MLPESNDIKLFNSATVDYIYNSYCNKNVQYVFMIKMRLNR